MATTFLQSPSFFSLPPRKLFLNQKHPQRQKQRLTWLAIENPSPKRFAICASASKKPRIKKKVKSNAELCSEIREFVSSVGLPEGHAPSTKELLEHGRSDLAYIVRRRGYKVMRELLSNSTEADNDGFDAEKSLAAKEDSIDDREYHLTGQDEKVNETVEIVSISTKVSLEGSSLNIEPDLNSNAHDGMSIESSFNSLEEEASYNFNGEDENANNVVEEDSLSTKVPVAENYSGSFNIDPYLHSIDYDGMSMELSTSSLEEDSSHNLNGQDEMANYVVEDSLSTKDSVVENCPGSLNIGSDLTFDHSSKPAESSVSSSFESGASYNLQGEDEKVSSVAEDVPSSIEVSTIDEYSPSSKIESTHHSMSSLEEKVAKFIQNGELDLVGDEIGAEESDGLTEQEEAIEEYPENVLAGSNTAVSLNGSISTSKLVAPPVTKNHHLRDDLFAVEGLLGADSGRNLVETINRENQVEINRLKSMLHQKELELSRLKEQIEKEKLALSVLQTKAEIEINKAEELVSEKCAELNAAEESLAGLQEVEIQYSGDGEIVEVAGSFNGWHHKIKLDPQSSSSTDDPTGSRKTGLWSTVLWLYPGTYEIKFIVDGQWKIDPQRDSVTRGTICNNILKVDR